jgi:GWxTD domain-containing protein
MPYKYVVNVFIEKADDGKLVNNLGTYFKRDSASVIPILHEFSIEDVETGNYNLVVELRNSENKLLESKSFFFQRYNDMPIEYIIEDELTAEDELNLTFVGKYNSPEELEEYLQCLHPISTQQEISYVNQGLRKNTLNVLMMKKFLYNFWKQRNPNDPEGEWLKYWADVEKVNAAYSTNHKKGYDTDRGRVYLQYGAPNTISPSYFEPNTYPYEIWHYYVLQDRKLNADQNNRKFVFANTEGGTSEFDLIHSDARNEITNQRWHHDLHSRSSQSINFDVEDAGGQYGSRSRDFFENPY